MNEVINNKPAYDPTSLEAWEQTSTRTLLYETQYGQQGVKFRIIDPLVILGEEGDAPNPLMGVVNKHIKPGEVDEPESETKEQRDERLGQVIMSDIESRTALSQSLNSLAIKVIIAPPLLEQGHNPGISVNSIPLHVKIDMFVAMFGGVEKLDAAATFPDRPGPSVLASQNS